MNFVFPEYTLKTEQREAETFVWDGLRKKWLLLTPEEYVRQQLVHYLIDQKQVSPALMGIEKEIMYNGQRKRLDLVVFDQEAHPLVLCECKAPEVPLSQQTLHQIARYNQSLQASHLLITNGWSWLFFSRSADTGQYHHNPSGWLDG